MQHGPQAQHQSGALQLLGIGVLGGVHVGDGIGQRTIVAQAAGQHERHIGAHAFVEDAARQAPGFDRLAHAAGMINGVDGAHVIAMAVLFLPSVGQAHAQRGAEQRRLRVVYAQRVAAEQRVYESAADQRRQTLHAAGVHHHRTGHHDHFQLLLERLRDQRRGLPHGRFHLPLRRDAVGHEGERQAVALLGFGRHADAAHPHHHAVARPDIAQAAAPGAAIRDHDQGVHALVLAPRSTAGRRRTSVR